MAGPANDAGPTLLARLKSACFCAGPTLTTNKAPALPFHDHAGHVRAGSTPPSAPREERGRSSPVLAMLAMLGPEVRACAWVCVAPVLLPRRLSRPEGRRAPIQSAIGWQQGKDAHHDTDRSEHLRDRPR
jgi:hypothetical protein